MKVTFCPVWIAATVMHSATEWLYPASIEALGAARGETAEQLLRDAGVAAETFESDLVEEVSE